MNEPAIQMRALGFSERLPDVIDAFRGVAVSSRVLVFNHIHIYIGATSAVSYSLLFFAFSPNSAAPYPRAYTYVVTRAYGHFIPLPTLMNNQHRYEFSHKFKHRNKVTVGARMKLPESPLLSRDIPRKRHDTRG